MKKILILPIVILLILINGCATSLSGIKEGPAKYAGRDVKISAYIALEAPIPFMDYSLYRVSDDSDEMFLFTDKKYNIDDKIFIKVHVIGISDNESYSAAEKIVHQTANFLIKNKMANSSTARTISQKLVRLISTLGNMAEGSYFLIAK